MEGLQKNLAILLEKQLETTITSFLPLTGGCIHQAGCLHTPKGSFFVKWNSSRKYPGIFEKEAEGLKKLASTRTVRLPEVLMTGHDALVAFLVLEYLPHARGDVFAWEQLGNQLAELHRHTGDFFGLETDNYIGSLPQSNRKHKDWLSFFTQERLLFQMERAVRQQVLDASTTQLLERCIARLPEFLPADQVPSLLHGDLWSGNVLMTQAGIPYLIDPAIYYGSREAELAFTQLFGGFPDRFYEAYEHSFPMLEGFEERIDLYNLYPLLVHANLFGGGYVMQIKSIVNAFA